MAVFSQRICLLTAALLAVLSAARVAADEYFTGDGTAYTLSDVMAGNCNFMYDPGVGTNYAALNADQWDNTMNCGRCAEVSCDDDRCSDTTSTVTVYLVDKCPECSKGDLDLSPTVFKTLTGNDPSRYSIKWKFVDCPVSGNLQYCTKTGSSEFWLAIQPANMLEGVTAVTIANQEVTMVDSAFYFLLSGGSDVDMTAVSVSVTGISGDVVTETLSLTTDSCTEGASQLAGSGSSSTGTTPTTTTTSAPTTTPKPTTATPTSTPTPTPTPTPTTATPKSTTETPTTTTATPTSTPTGTTATQSSTSSGSSGGYRSALTDGSSDAGSLAAEADSSAAGLSAAGSDSSVAGSSAAGSDSSSSNSSWSLPGTVSPADQSPGSTSIQESTETTVTDPTTTRSSGETATSAPASIATSSYSSGSEESTRANTESSSSSSGTSVLIIVFGVVAGVGAVVLGTLAFVVKKKKLDDKRDDRDAGALRSFDTLNSPVRMNNNIANL